MALFLLGLSIVQGALATNYERPVITPEGIFEWNIESRKTYDDPFSEVEVDVVFTKAGESWRVPAFWRGGTRWTVRFAPPASGTYSYFVESTDLSNPDLNGHKNEIGLTGYSGANPLLKHGMLRVTKSGRSFEYADGTPFFWLGDTWWTGLSDRLSWDGFQKMASDRRDKDLP